jgi:hypothetical protein
MTAYHVGYLVGSLAKASINRLLSNAVVRLAPPELKLSEISFKDPPLYGYDYDADYPPVARAFKQAIADSDCCSSSRSTTVRSRAASRTRSTGRADPGGRTHSHESRRR